MNSPAPKTPLHLQTIQTEMDLLNETIRQNLYSEVPLINTISEYIIGAGGKRLRPALVIMLSKAVNASPSQLHIAITLATVIEFIHTATLLHDDVVDNSTMRRNRLTANAEYGNSAAVLVGDFLYSRAFQMMTKIGLMPVMNLMADTTNTIAEGEVLQLLNCKNPKTTEAQYMQVIQFKTAKLFEAASQLAGIVCNLPEAQIKMLGQFGANLGAAFQLIDDVLDYEGNANNLGKQVGDDLREGKPTLPLIYALEHGSSTTQTHIEQAITNGGTNDVEPILQEIQACGALSYTRQQAEKLADQARSNLHFLPESDYKKALNNLCTIAIHRAQ